MSEIESLRKMVELSDKILKIVHDMSEITGNVQTGELTIEEKKELFKLYEEWSGLVAIIIAYLSLLSNGTSDYIVRRIKSEMLLEKGNGFTQGVGKGHEIFNRFKEEVMSIQDFAIYLHSLLNWLDDIWQEKEYKQLNKQDVLRWCEEMKKHCYVVVDLIFQVIDLLSRIVVGVAGYESDDQHL